MNVYKKNSFCRPGFRVVFVFTFFLLAGCVTGLRPGHYTDLKATPKRFTVCHGYGCSLTTPVSLTRSQWKEVVSPFKQSAENAESERRQMAKSIALMERFVGEVTGTHRDKGEAGFIVPAPGQMDCIDETINTSLYLNFLERAGLFVWHKVAKPARRGFFLDGKWPHNTAVVREKENGRRFVIDSWFFDNGKEPSIVPVEAWLAGWRP